MITVPTALILGAGASKPFGYPLGVELVDIICKRLKSNEHRDYQNLLDLGHDQEKINEFRKELSRSRRYSVDAFLEYRKEFIPVGKSAIANALVQYEDEKALFEKDDWYRYFFDKLTTSFEEFGQNKVSIITFNYDRSLEQYLFTALQNAYHKSENECASKIKDIPIVHVYGQLEYLPWQNYIKTPSEPWRLTEDRRPYGPLRNIEDLKYAASSIKIINEEIDIDKNVQFSLARSYLSHAERIIFLGFGYHEENLRRLNIPSEQHRVKVYNGTAYKLGDVDRNNVSERFGSEEEIFLAPRDFNILKFFNEIQGLY